MLCPECKVDMFVLEFEQVEIDFCFTCKGVWLDAGELEVIGERAGALQGGLLSALETKGTRTAAKGKRRCPVCRKRLAEVTTEGDPPIVVDRCPKRHGLWFDRGELAGVVEIAGADSENILARFLADLATGDEEEPETGDSAGRTGEAEAGGDAEADAGPAG